MADKLVTPTPARKPEPQPLDVKAAIKGAMAQDLKVVAPNEVKKSVTDEQVGMIVTTLSNNFQMTPSLVMTAIFLLFLKGAASNGTPLTLSVEVGDKTVSKRDLLIAYELVTRNKYLRRLAESLAKEIGEFAQRNGLRGELARRIDTALQAEGEAPLNPQEAAWCSSFSQCLTDLKTLSGSDRLVKQISADYNKRFGDTKKKKSNSSKSSPQKGSKPAAKGGKPSPSAEGAKKAKPQTNKA